MSLGRPLISVVMPVHNARQFLDESIVSILNQTLADFEFIVLDDGSTDGCVDILARWAGKDDRLSYYRSEVSLGLSGSSNFVVSKCSTPLIARMDADDISHPDRLRRQFEVLKSMNDVVAVGTLCDGIDTEGRTVRPRDRWRIVRRSDFIPFPHGSVMFRRQEFETIGGYSQLNDGGEDQDLFKRMAKVGRVVTLPDVLYRYRYHQTNSTLVNGKRLVSSNHHTNGDELATLYRLGAMRLWSGHRPMILQPLLAKRPFTLDAASLFTLTSATWGAVNPATLRIFLRSMLRVRDFAAGLKVKDGQPYEWRSE